MNTQIIETDKKIFDIATEVEKNFLNYINPINSQKQKEMFFESIKKHSYEEPYFEYLKRDSNTLSKEEEQLRTAIKEMKNSPAEKHLKEKAENLILEINLLKNVNTDKFCNSSKKSYDKPSTKVVKMAEEAIKVKIKPEKDALSAEEMKIMLEKYLTPLKSGFSVTIEEHMSAKAAEHLAERKVKLNKNALFCKNDAKRLFVHEVETHAYRYLNGMLQPIKCLSFGSGGEYMRTEEGLAVFNEKKSGVFSPQNEKTYAGRVVAVNYALSHSFFETFEYLKNFFLEDEAYTLTQRVKRGVPYSKKGAFTKDYSYYAGAKEIENYAQNEKLTKELYIGKISVTDMGLVKKISGIVEPKWLPSYLHK
jgi:uncharacterized protein (TIGR02421 family)